MPVNKPIISKRDAPIQRLHKEAFKGIVNTEDLQNELNLIVEKRSTRPYRQRMYLLWFAAQEIKSNEDAV